MVIGVARMFDWRGPNHKSHAITSCKIFKRRDYLWDKDLRMEDEKLMLRLVRNQDYAMREGFNQKLKCFYDMC